MAHKVPTTDLKVGMFVSDLDRPWTDTPFLLQGFLIEDDEQIRDLRKHCEWVMVDRARSVGDQFQAEGGAAAAPGQRGAPASSKPGAGATAARGGSSATIPPPPSRPAQKDGRTINLEDVARGIRRGAGPGGPVDMSGYAGGPQGEGVVGRMLGGLKGMFGGRKGEGVGAEAAQRAAPEPVTETPAEFEARASLLPAGIQVQTYQNVVTVEEEAPRARAVVEQASNLLEKLVGDIRLGQSFEVERVEEIVDDMVESIVRNPQALMWVARLREQDITTYGHGLQVSVYLTSFGRHLGFPKGQLSQLAQVGLLLDIGKIRLPKELLEKQGRLNDEEFETVKAHVNHSIEILGETPGFSPDIMAGIEQHHERMNGSGYPKGLVGDEIGIFGRMAGIVDCFAALTNHRPYAAAVSSYEALRSITSWGGDYFHEPLVQQFVSSVGVFPVGSLIELSTGEVAVVVEHSKVRRLKPRVLVVTDPDKKPVSYPAMLDLLYDPKRGSAESAFIKRGLAPGAYGLDLKDFFLA